VGAKLGYSAYIKTILNSLTLKQQRGCKAAARRCFEYIGGPLELSSALLRIPKSVDAKMKSH